MMIRSAGEILIRSLLFIPLIYITWQVLYLSRILASRAWLLIFLGILAFALWVTYTIFFEPHPRMRIFATMIGYVLLGAGFHLLRGDLDRILKRR